MLSVQILHEVMGLHCQCTTKMSRSIAYLRQCMHSLSQTRDSCTHYWNDQRTSVKCCASVFTLAHGQGRYWVHTHTHTHMHACTHTCKQTPTHPHLLPPPLFSLSIADVGRNLDTGYYHVVAGWDWWMKARHVARSFTTSCQLVSLDIRMSLFTRSIHLVEVLPCSLFFPLGLHFKSCFWGHSSYILFTWPNHCKRLFLSVLQLAVLQSSTSTHPHTHTPTSKLLCTYSRKRRQLTSVYLVQITAFTYIRAYVHLLKGHPEMEHGLCM